MLFLCTTGYLAPVSEVRLHGPQRPARKNLPSSCLLWKEQELTIIFEDGHLLQRWTEPSKVASWKLQPSSLKGWNSLDLLE